MVLEIGVADKNAVLFEKKSLKIFYPTTMLQKVRNVGTGRGYLNEKHALILWLP